MLPLKPLRSRAKKHTSGFSLADRLRCCCCASILGCVCVVAGFRSLLRARSHLRLAAAAVVHVNRKRVGYFIVRHQGAKLPVQCHRSPRAAQAAQHHARGQPGGGFFFGLGTAAGTAVAFRGGAPRSGSGSSGRGAPCVLAALADRRRKLCLALAAALVGRGAGKGCVAAQVKAQHEAVGLDTHTSLKRRNTWPSCIMRDHWQGKFVLPQPGAKVGTRVRLVKTLVHKISRHRYTGIYDHRHFSTYLTG